MLPGYVPIIAYLLVFQPTFLFGAQGISYDVLSAIVFIVAGPALGLTLAQFHRGLLAIYTILKPRIMATYACEDTKTKKAKTMEYLKHYAAICLNENDNERRALEETEATYNFCVSTSVSFLGLTTLGFFRFGFLRFEPWAFLIGGIILLATGYLEYTQTYTPLYYILEDKYAKNGTEEIY